MTVDKNDELNEKIYEGLRKAFISQLKEMLMDIEVDLYLSPDCCDQLFSIRLKCFIDDFIDNYISLDIQPISGDIDRYTLNLCRKFYIRMLDDKIMRKALKQNVKELYFPTQQGEL